MSLTIFGSKRKWGKEDGADNDLETSDVDDDLQMNLKQGLMSLRVTMTSQTWMSLTLRI